MRERENRHGTSDGERKAAGTAKHRKENPSEGDLLDCYRDQ